MTTPTDPTNSELYFNTLAAGEVKVYEAMGPTVSKVTRMMELAELALLLNQLAPETDSRKQTESLSDKRYLA